MTWYLVRASGMVAYALLTGSMLWGLWLSTRTPAPQGRAWVLEVHKALGGVAVLATLGHMAALLADSYVSFGPADVLVPFASAWNPVAVAWGVIAAWLLGAVQVTSMLRRTLTKRSWRKVHLASFAAYLLAAVHFLTAGTDAGNPIVLGLTLGSLTMVAVATVVRATQHLGRPVPRKETPTWNRPPTPVAAMPAGPPPVSAAAPPRSVPAPPWPPAS